MFSFCIYACVTACFTKNITRMRNCPDITIWNNMVHSMDSIGLFFFFPFVLFPPFAFFCIFVQISLWSNVSRFKSQSLCLNSKVAMIQSHADSLIDQDRYRAARAAKTHHQELGWYSLPVKVSQKVSMLEDGFCEQCTIEPPNSLLLLISDHFSTTTTTCTNLLSLTAAMIVPILLLLI